MYEFFTDDFAGLSAALWNWIATGICILLAVLLVVALIKFLRGPKLGNRRGRNTRLAVTDATAIGDDRRKLVLVRRDNVEHLLLIGGPTDLVIESNIVKAPAPNKTPDKMAELPVKQFSKVAKEVPRQDPALMTPEPTTPAAVAKAKPAPMVAPPKSVTPAPAVTPEPAPQPAVAASPSVAPQVTAPTPSTQSSTTSTSVPVATAVIAAPIVAAATDEKVTKPEAIADNVSAPSVETTTTPPEKSDTKLGPVEEMDALLKEISGEK